MNMNKKIVKSFIYRVKGLTYTARKMEFLYYKKKICLRDLEQVYRGLFLDVVSAFEKSIEDLFLNLLSKRFSVFGFRANIRTNNKESAIRLLFNEKKFINWLPYENTIAKAKIYFKNGYPFTSLDEYEKATIKEILTIRNCIAHSSDYSVGKFKQMISGYSFLSTPEKKPIGFLRGFLSQNLSRFLNYIYKMRDIINKICI